MLPHLEQWRVKVMIVLVTDGIVGMFDTFILKTKAADRLPLREKIEFFPPSITITSLLNLWRLVKRLFLVCCACARRVRIPQEPIELRAVPIGGQAGFQGHRARMAFRLSRGYRGQVVAQAPLLASLFRVAISGPSKYNKLLRPHRLARSRTPGFQSGNTGSNPVGDTKLIIHPLS